MTPDILVPRAPAPYRPRAVTDLVWLGLAAALAGAINSVAGGGSLISFPALIAVGVPPVAASATNTAALAPGSLAAAFGYRAELGDNARLTLRLAAAAAVGAALGAALLLWASQRVFTWLVPWLVLIATLTLLLQERLTPASVTPGAPPSRRRSLGVAALLLLAAVYGGYFGAGIGMVTLALLGQLRRMDIHRMNAAKTVIVGAINTVAALYLLLQGAVQLRTAAVMALGAVAGGYGGARLARGVNPKHVRVVVILLGAGITLALAARYWL